LNQHFTSVLHSGHGKPQILRIILGTSVAPTHHCQRDSMQGGKGMLPLRFFRQSYREAMQPREEKATSLTTADLIRMCRATSSRDFQSSQNEREDHSADRSRWHHCAETLGASFKVKPKHGVTASTLLRASAMYLGTF